MQLFNDEIIYTKRQNYIYKYLFKNYFKYFYNSKIILVVLDNFKHEIVNFLFVLSSKMHLHGYCFYWRTKLSVAINVLNINYLCLITVHTI